jgi:hypothetical protein
MESAKSEGYILEYLGLNDLGEQFGIVKLIDRFESD